jgi:hypothetical protein
MKRLLLLLSTSLAIALAMGCGGREEAEPETGRAGAPGMEFGVQGSDTTGGQGGADQAVGDN